MNATLTPARYAAARINGRYRVIDTTLPEGANIVGTRASKAKAEEAAATLNAEDSRVTTDPAELTVLLDAAARLDALPTEEDATEEEPPAIWAAAVASGQVSFAEMVTGVLGGAPAPAAPLEVVTLDGADATVEVTATPAVKRVALGTLPERKAAKKTAAVKAEKPAAPAATAQIGKGVVRWTLTTEDAGTVAYTSGSTINRDYAKAVAEGRSAIIHTVKGNVIREFNA